MCTRDGDEYVGEKQSVADDKIDGMNTAAKISAAVARISGGGVVAIPTDTLYGLAADALNPAAVERVYTVKGRPADLPLPVLVSGWEQVSQVADLRGSVAALARKLAARFWPGSLTLVLPAMPGLPARLTANRDTIAVRMPDHPVPLALARELGRPITGTSANPSGQPDITDPCELRRLLGGLVDDMIICGPEPLGTASTIVSVSAEGVTLLREGALPYRDILIAVGGA